MSRKYKIFLWLLIFYIFCAVAISALINIEVIKEIEASAIKEILEWSEKELLSPLKRVGYFKLHAIPSHTMSLNSSPFTSIYYINPLSWIHVLVIILLFTISAVTDWLLD